MNDEQVRVSIGLLMSLIILQVDTVLVNNGFMVMRLVKKNIYHLKMANYLDVIQNNYFDILCMFTLFFSIKYDGNCKVASEQITRLFKPIIPIEIVKNLLSFIKKPNKMEEMLMISRKLSEKLNFFKIDCF